MNNGLIDRHVHVCYKVVLPEKLSLQDAAKLR